MVRFDETVVKNIISDFQDIQNSRAIPAENKCKIAYMNLNRYGLINDNDLIGLINQLIGLNEKTIDSLNYGCSLYKDDNDSLFNDLVLSFAKNNLASLSQSSFSRDLSSLVLFGGEHAGHYFAQNDQRWRDTRYRNSNVGSGACEAISIVNCLANVGYYDTFDTESELVGFVCKNVVNGNNSVSGIADALNKERAKNGKDKVNFTQFKNKDGKDLVDKAQKLEVGESCSGIVKGDDFIDRIESIEATKDDSTSYQYSFAKTNSGAGSVLTNGGHYITINHFEFDENGEVKYVYVYDSYIREYTDAKVNINGEEVNISGYKSGASEVFEIVTPGILRVPVENLDKLMLGSGTLIVTKNDGTSEGN